MSAEFRYLALGDSYTVGEALEAPLSFPYQLADRFRDHALIRPVVIAKTGWTTDELLDRLRERPVEGTFDLVTLLIGVNNQYRGYPVDIYQTEFATLLRLAIDYAAGRPERVIVISIPDWGVTPFAAEDKRSSAEIAAAIDRFNEVGGRITEEAGAHFVSITEGSRRAAEDPGLIASDGLHPSGKMYREWVDALFGLVGELL